MDEHQRHGPARGARRRLPRHGRRRQLVGDRQLERAGRRGLRRLPRPPAAPRCRRQSDRGRRSTRSPSSSATTARPTTSSCRPPTRPGRPTTAGAATTAQVGANLYGDPSGSVNWDPIPRAPAPHSQDRAYAVSYNRPFITDDRRARRLGRAGLSVRRRLCGDLLAREERLRRLLHLGRRHRPARRRLPQELQGLHLRRP